MGVVVDSKISGSPSCHLPVIMRGLQLVGCNGVPIRGKAGLRTLEDLLGELLADEPVRMTFATPLHVVTENDCWLDVDVGGVVRSFRIDHGLAYTHEDFARVVQESARRNGSASLEEFACAVDCENEMFTISSGGAPVQLLFGSGDHASRSCWMHLGFGCGADTPVAEALRSPKWSRGAIPVESGEAQLRLRPEALRKVSSLAPTEGPRKPGLCSPPFGFSLEYTVLTRILPS